MYYIEPSERNAELKDNEIIDLKYSDKTVIAITNRQYIYLFFRKDDA